MPTLDTHAHWFPPEWVETIEREARARLGSVVAGQIVARHGNEERWSGSDANENGGWLT